jgi:hypothetical protein
MRVRRSRAIAPVRHLDLAGGNMPRALSTMLLLIFAVPAQAEGFAVVAKGSTLGFGLDISKAFSERWATRISMNGISFDRDIRETDVEYDADVDLRTVGLLLDWHPGGHAFRISAGVYYNGNEARASARPTGGSFRINGRDYAAAEIASLDGTIDFRAAAPYVGIGFGNAGKRGFKFSIDIGALYQNSPRVDLRVLCGTTPDCPQLQNDVQAEAARLGDELKDFRWWPVIGAGFGWAF